MRTSLRPWVLWALHLYRVQTKPLSLHIRTFITSAECFIGNCECIELS